MMVEVAGKLDHRSPASVLPINRRALLGVGATALAGAALAPLLTARAATGTGSVRFVIVDRKHAQSRRFASAMAAEGAEALDVNDGLTALWSQRLVPLWRNPQGAVVGLTTRSVWDGLSQQAMGQFRKARLIGIHHIDQSHGRARHSVEVPASRRAMLASGGFDTAAWPDRIAQVVTQCVGADRRDMQACRFGDATIPAQAGTQLVSWMIV
ncbi:hypothetical protein [Croceicoccus bisphenolivorans]|uniref:hypothetical protein n=1 Tax=Croceicoccus bisphenolivorans TaxID=1783232 RepID=UPI00082959B5|nr:hypothetical protein [Croceicoccus bisphenolivorans]